MRVSHRNMYSCKNSENLPVIFEEVKTDLLKKDDKVSDQKKDSINSDEVIAGILQMQLDKECDKPKCPQEKIIPPINYKKTLLTTDMLNDSDDDELSNFENIDILDQEYAFMSQCGTKSKKIKKHDIISGKKNSCKFVSIPPRFQIVDGGKFDFKLSNKVDNRLKMRKAQNPKIQEKPTFNFDVDENSNILLSKMIQNQVLKKINGVIGQCHDYTVFHAHTGPNISPHPNIPKECSIKVFKPIDLSESLQSLEYKKSKESSQKIAEDKAKKEMINLRRLTRASVPCPKVIAHNKNILILSFIGTNGIAAANLLDAHLTDKEYVFAYNKVVKVMNIMFKKLHLIHGNLSPCNILWHHSDCYFIDVNQSLNYNEENTFKTLLEDCTRVVSYFSKKGVPAVLSPYDLLTSVTDCYYSDRFSLDTIHKRKSYTWN